MNSLTKLSDIWSRRLLNLTKQRTGRPWLTRNSFSLKLPSRRRSMRTMSLSRASSSTRKSWRSSLLKFSSCNKICRQPTRLLKITPFCPFWGLVSGPKCEASSIAWSRRKTKRLISWRFRLYSETSQLIRRRRRSKMSNRNWKGYNKICWKCIQN